MTGLADQNPSSNPLAVRLREVADLSYPTQTDPALLREAADAIEYCAAEIVRWRRLAYNYQSLLGERGLL